MPPSRKDAVELRFSRLNSGVRFDTGFNLSSGFDSEALLLSADRGR
ncbi:MAG TPA: hypothetical protein V6D14_28010 [Coleofasciculaceae cyanobacterium]